MDFKEVVAYLIKHEDDLRKELSSAAEANKLALDEILLLKKRILELEGQGPTPEPQPEAVLAITTDRLNMRDVPNGTKLSTLDKGAEVLCLRTQLIGNGIFHDTEYLPIKAALTLPYEQLYNSSTGKVYVWVNIKYQDKEGWVAAAWLKLKEVSPPT